MIPVSRFFIVQEPSNTLLSYTQKGIDFFEKLGHFSKEKAIIEEEYSTKLKNLAKKYTKKSEEDDEILKSVTYVNAFNAYLQQLDQIAGKHHESAESIREEIVSYASSKTCQLRSARKNAISDLKTVNDRLEEHINEMLKCGKAYVKSFKEAENAYQKFYKADKNLEISRLELEKTRAHATTRNEACEKAKNEYAQSVSSANSEQNKYHKEMLPVIFARLKAVDKESISDMSHVLQKMLTLDEHLAEKLGNCRKAMQSVVDRIDPEADAQHLLQSVEAMIERPSPFDMEDLGDPKDCETRSNDSHDGKPRVEVAASSYHILKSPSKKTKIRSFLGIQGKEKENETKKSEMPVKEAYADKTKPAHVRLSCLRSKIREEEKQLEQAIQGREGIRRLQKAYYANPQHGNPAACSEPLISYTKKIESLQTKIQNLEEFYTLLEMSTEGSDGSRCEKFRSFGGRDTPDTTRSTSSKPVEDTTFGDGSSSATSTQIVGISEDSAKNMFRQFISSPKRLIASPKLGKSPQIGSPMRRKKEISSPVLRSSFSGVIRKTSTASCSSTASSPHRSVSSPIRIDQSCSIKETHVVALFEFEKSSAETMSIKAGDELIVQEIDTGDGWTKARKKRGSQETGFVPTSYLQFTAPSSPASQ